MSKAGPGLTPTQFVMELRTTESHGSSLLRKREPRNPKDQGTAAVLGTSVTGFRPRIKYLTRVGISINVPSPLTGEG